MPRVALAGMVLLGLVAPEARGSSPGFRRPNLLVVTFDTTRADRLGCYGYDQVRTPNIDRLAREGTRFERAYSQAAQTLPSHASLFTGFYPATLNVLSNGQKVSEEISTLAEMLRQAGYRTGAILGAAPLKRTYNLDQGFQTYDDRFRSRAPAKAFNWALRLFTNGRANISLSRPAHRVAARAVAWLEAAARRPEPFFLWLHFFDPHEPYVAHPDLSRPKLKRQRGPLNRHGVKERNYVSEIEFADHHLGRVLRRLDTLKLTADTLTIFTADHGESLGEHGYRGHRREVYESIIRVPLIVRLPGRVAAGVLEPTPAMLIDVVPTALRLLRLPTGGSRFEGRDLFNLDEGPPRTVYSAAVKFFTRAPTRIAEIRGDEKFVFFPRTGRSAMFNLRVDPQERHNLLEPPGLPNVDVAARRAALQRWWHERDRYDPEELRLSEEDLAHLESLGYVR